MVGMQPSELKVVIKRLDERWEKGYRFSQEELRKK